MHHFATPNFWRCYNALPSAIRDLADKNYKMLKSDPTHPSLQFKHVGNYCSARIGLHYRTLAVVQPDGLLWFWIGSHAEYDKLTR